MTTTKSTKATALKYVEAPEVTVTQFINESIVRVIEATGINIQKNRYKAMRAIAFQAFIESIEVGDFDNLVDRAIENVYSLPAGWEIERVETVEALIERAEAEVAKAAKKAPAKEVAPAPIKETAKAEAATAPAKTATPAKRRRTVR